LTPFLCTYLVFCNFFVTLYAVIGVEADEELLTPGSKESLNQYGLLFLAVWRNSVGKLGVPGYETIYENQTGWIRLTTINIIWIIYIVQILFNLVIGLNFMIAIIESTYSKVSGEKEKYIIRNKAEMNIEAFEIIQYIPYYENIEFRGIVFSTFHDGNEEEVVVHGRKDEIDTLLEYVEGKLEENFE